MRAKKVEINRAPVLTLWAAVVAERLGYDPDTALTLGKAVAGLNAQSKGKRIGIFGPGKENPIKVRRKHEKQNKEMSLSLLGRPLTVIRTSEGLRASIKGKMIEPKSVQDYLCLKFGDDLGVVRKAMETLSHAYDKEDLALRAYSLYEKFRPAIPKGEKGWGAHGTLDLSRIVSLTP